MDSTNLQHSSWEIWNAAEQPLKFKVKNKVVLKERDARSDLANFIGEKKYKNIC